MRAQRLRTAGRLGVVLTLLAAVVAGIGSASASQLNLTSSAISTASVGHPCPGAATATVPAGAGPTFGAVRLTVPAACVNTSVLVTLVDGSGVAHSSAATVLTSTTQDVAVPTYTATSVSSIQATVNGWDLPTTWSAPAPGPIVPGSTNTVISSISWTQPAENQVCAVVTVTTNTSAKSWWLVNLNVGQPPFNGATSGYQLDGQVQFTPSGTAQNGVLTIQGANNGWGNLSQGSEKTFTVCHWGTPPPADNPSAYNSVTVNGTWTDTEACVVTTITGNGSSTFYFGWAVPVDMTAAFQRIQSAGYPVTRLALFPGSPTEVGASPALSPATSQYVLQSGWQGVLRQTESTAVTLCAYRY